MALEDSEPLEVLGHPDNKNAISKCKMQRHLHTDFICRLNMSAHWQWLTALTGEPFSPFTATPLPTPGGPCQPREIRAENHYAYALLRICLQWEDMLVWLTRSPVLPLSPCRMRMRETLSRRTFLYDSHIHWCVFPLNQRWKRTSLPLHMVSPHQERKPITTWNQDVKYIC